jgi:hypothetical protein
MNYNLSNPDINNLANNETIIVAGYQKDYVFSNNACSLFGGDFCSYYYENPKIYNNLTIGSYVNQTFSFPNDGYLIIKIESVLDANNPSIYPTIGTFGIASYSEEMINYYTISSYYQVNALCFNATTGGYSTCPVSKPSNNGFSFYPLNSSATYMIPVSRGNEKISFGNFNQYPISISFKLTYVGLRYSNLTSISTNYSDN